MKRNFYFVFLGILLLASISCSSKKEVEPLDENLVFNESSEDVLNSVDFDSDDSEFAALDKDVEEEDLSFETEDALDDINFSEEESADLDFDDFEPGDADGSLASQENDADLEFDDDLDGASLEDTGSDDISFDDFGTEKSEDLSFEDFENQKSKTDSDPGAEGETFDLGEDDEFAFDDLEGAGGSEELSFEGFEEDAASEEKVQENIFSQDQPFIEDIAVAKPSLDSGGGEITFSSPPDTDQITLEIDDGTRPAQTFSGTEETKVLSVDYNAFQRGGAFIISTDTDPEFETEFIPETNQYVLKLKDTSISSSLKRPFLTKDFKQSFEAMNSYRSDDNGVRFVFQLKKGSFPKVSRIDRTIIVEPGIEGANGLTSSLLNKDNHYSSSGNGISQGEAMALGATTFEDFLSGTTKFVGEPISLQVRDEDVVTIIQFISEEVGANIVVSDSVKGKLSIKLKEVPWDQALVSIMKMKALGYVRNGNILRVAPLEELRKESLAAAEVRRTQKTLAPFHVKVFPLSYAKPQTIEKKIQPFLTSSGEKEGRKGQVISEERSSSIIIRDTLDVIQSIAKLVKELDRPPLQVMIQAKVVEASKEFSKTIESLFSAGLNSNAATGSSSVSGSLPWNFGNKKFFAPEISISGIDFLGTLRQQIRLQELENKAKVLSAPSVLAINNEKALILQTDEVLNEQRITDPSGRDTFTLQRDPVELRLEVTPQVSSDGNIIMDVIVKREFAVKQALGNAKKSREASTKVIVGNNKTAMIGGIYQVAENKNESGIPVIRKIPLLKWLFGNKFYEKIDTELVVFVTPRIVETAIQPAALGQGLGPLNPGTGSAREGSSAF